MRFIEKLPASWQAAIALLAQPIVKRIGVDYDMTRIYSELGVGRTSAFDAARLFIGKIETPPGSLKEERKKNQELDKELRLMKIHIDVLRYLPEHPGSWVERAGAEERHQFSDEFKAFLVLKKNEYDLEWGEIGELLGIPESTLKKFKSQVDEKSSGDGGGPSVMDLPDVVIDQLRKFFQGRSGKATVKDFCEKNPDVLTELKMSYAAFASCLLRLGFTSPKGIFLNNTGLDRIVRFNPHAIWGTDGKEMKIVLNGEIFHFVWQCLIDYKSTVLVGGLVGWGETTENLLEAIRQAKQATGVAPMAIVIDGRLSENLPAIRAYLDEMGIEIVRTFPGNPKSNGIVEGNFNIFEKWVGGKVVIQGETAEGISLSIAKMLTEVFTQLRNNQPRKGLGQKTANEVLAASPKLTMEEESTIRQKIQALANRFRNEQAIPVVSERKLQALNQAIEVVMPPDQETFRKRLRPSMFTVDLILDAIAIFKKQQLKNPEKKFDHTYFGGILRNLVDQRSVELLYTQLEHVYNDHWARMAKAMRETGKAPETAVDMCERLAKEFLEAKIPAHAWIALASLQSAFMLGSRAAVTEAQGLRERIGEQIKKSKMACVEKRQRILRKLFECEALVRQIARPPITTALNACANP
jgi:hypothetical protein